MTKTIEHLPNQIKKTNYKPFLFTEKNLMTQSPFTSIVVVLMDRNLK